MSGRIDGLELTPPSGRQANHVIDSKCSCQRGEEAGGRGARMAAMSIAASSVSLLSVFRGQVQSLTVMLRACTLK